MKILSSKLKICSWKLKKTKSQKIPNLKDWLPILRRQCKTTTNVDFRVRVSIVKQGSLIKHLVSWGQSRKLGYLYKFPFQKIVARVNWDVYDDMIYVIYMIWYITRGPYNIKIIYVYRAVRMTRLQLIVMVVSQECYFWHLYWRLFFEQ